VKYEEVYLRAYNSVSEAQQSIGRYLDFYNARRPHQPVISVDTTRLLTGVPPSCGLGRNHLRV
jgi:hypothetical protein